MTQRQARGADPSLSVRLLGVATWNTRQQRWRIDLPGGAWWEQKPRHGGTPRFASPRFVVTVLTLCGVSVASLALAAVAYAWQWIQGVAG